MTRSTADRPVAPKPDAPKVSTAEPEQAPGTRTSPQWGHLTERWALLGLFVVMMVTFIATADGFANAQNLRIVLGTGAPLVILAISAMIPLAIGQFDLSVAAIAGTAGIALVAACDRFGMPIWLSITIAVVISGLIGACSGYLVAVLKVNVFIVTLGVSTVLQGVVQGYSGGAVLTGDLGWLSDTMTGTLWGIPKGVFWFVPVAGAIWYLIEHTPTGRHVRAIGSNEGAAGLLGIRTRALTLAAFVLAGVLAAIAGIAMTVQNGSADPSVTLGTQLLPAMAAVFLGASAFTPGLFNVVGTVLAVYTVAYLVNGLQYLGAEPWTSPVINGAVLIGAVTIASLLKRNRSRG